MNVKSNLSSMYGKMVDRCVCCGNPIPEGRQVCPACDMKVRPDLRPDRILDDLKKLLTIKVDDEWTRLRFFSKAYGIDGAETKRVRAVWVTYDEVLRMLDDPERIRKELKIEEDE